MQQQQVHPAENERKKMIWMSQSSQQKKNKRNEGNINNNGDAAIAKKS
jgi:hypothetical protein